MIIPNNTHYFNYLSRTHNQVPDVGSFGYESSKRLAYQQRLYYQMQDTVRCDGQAFFYTFTYNNKSIPMFYDGVKHYPCFNYAHIRLITNGLISKQLARNYGSQLRYFCACETGEGKGVRGLGNNPHYHFIFFVSPIRDENNNPIYDNYKKIDPLDFRELCRKVWQYSLDKEGNVLETDYRSAKFGHVQEGRNFGLVDSSDCFSYVSKYVTKDDDTKKLEGVIYNYVKKTYDSLFITNNCLYCYYNYLRLNINGYDKYQFFEDHKLSEYYNWRKTSLWKDTSYLNFAKTYYSDILAENLSPLWQYWHDIYLPYAIKKYTRELSNQFSSKVRTSKSLGIYGLQFCRDIETKPTIDFPSKKGVKAQKPCLYYYRKLYYDVVKCEYTGNPLYVINERGIQLKLYQLPTALWSMEQTTKKAVNFFINQYNKNYEGYLDNLSNYNNCISAFRCLGSKQAEIFKKFACYSVIYRYRHYSCDSFGVSDNTLDLKRDYETFLRNNIYSLDYSDCSINFYISTDKKRIFCSYLSHPYFSEILPYIDFIDECLKQYNIINSDYHKGKFEEQSRLMKSLKSVEYQNKSDDLFFQ